MNPGEMGGDPLLPNLLMRGAKGEDSAKAICRCDRRPGEGSPAGRLWVASIGKPQSSGYLAARALIVRFFPFSEATPGTSRSPNS